MTAYKVYFQSELDGDYIVTAYSMDEATSFYYGVSVMETKGYTIVEDKTVDITDLASAFFGACDKYLPNRI